MALGTVTFLEPGDCAMPKKRSRVFAPIEDDKVTR